MKRPTRTPITLALMVLLPGAAAIAVPDKGGFAAPPPNVAVNTETAGRRMPADRAATWRWD